MTIAGLMTRTLKHCRSTDSLDRAAQLMWDFDIGALPVVDDRGQLIGMITDRDICMAAYTRGETLPNIPVAHAMTTHVVSCRPDDTIKTAANLMANHKIRRIPVVDDDQRPVGVVSLNDLAIATIEHREMSPLEMAGTLAAICEHRDVSPPM